MAIELHVRPKTAPMSFQDFCEDHPPRSIALDGYVRGGPAYNARGPWVNFNHHAEVSRLETRATCAQVLISIRQGLFDAFRDERGKAAHLYVNDCDEDVALSVFLLRHSHLVEGTMNPILNRLVSMEDMLDTTAGAYPFPPDLPSLRELAWIFDPYRRLRVSGQLELKQTSAFDAVIHDIELRILQLLAGRGQELALDTRYDVLHQGRGWAMVREVGANARTGMFADGIRAFVAVRDRPDGAFTYTLGRMSLFVPFPVDALCTLFGARDNEGGDCWGGGDIVGGSPRIRGSRLLPAEVVEAIAEVMALGEQEGAA